MTWGIRSFVAVLLIACVIATWIAIDWTYSKQLDNYKSDKMRLEGELQSYQKKPEEKTSPSRASGDIPAVNKSNPVCDMTVNLFQDEGSAVGLYVNGAHPCIGSISTHNERYGVIIENK